MVKLIKYLLLSFSTLFILSCGNSGVKITKNDTLFLNKNTAKKIELAFENADDINEKNSKWLYGREQALNLTIIGPVYDIGAQKHTQGYKKLKALFEQVYESPKILDIISGQAIGYKFNKIDYIPFRLNSEEHDKFSIIEQNKNKSKDFLNDILINYDNNSLDKNSMSIAIKIKYSDIEKGYLTLQGYKTVKELGKIRNSHYFNLTKKISTLSDNDITNAFAAIMQLEIPEYISVDRSKDIEQGRELNIVQRIDNKYSSTIWLNEASNAINTLKANIQDIEKNPIPNLKNTKYFNKHSILSMGTDYDNRIIVLGTNSKIKVYKNRTLINDINTHNNKTVCVDTKAGYIVSAGEDAVINVYKINSTAPIKQYNMHKSGISKLKIIPNTNLVISGNIKASKKNDNLKVWNLQNAKTIKNLHYHYGGITALAVSNNGKYAVSAGDDNSIVLWDLKSFSKVWSRSNVHSNSITDLSISDNNNYILSSSWDNSVQLIRLDNGSTVKNITNLSKGINSVDFVSSSKFFITTDLSGNIELYDMRGYKKIKSLKETNYFSAFKNYGNYMLAINNNNVKAFDITARLDSNKLSDKKGEINSIESSKEYISSKSFQKINTKSLSPSDLSILFTYGYINFKNQSDISMDQIKNILESMNSVFIDPIPYVLYGDTLNSNTNTAVSKSGNIYIIESPIKYNIDNLYIMSDFDLNEEGFKKRYFKNGFNTSKEAVYNLETAK